MTTNEAKHRRSLAEHRIRVGQWSAQRCLLGKTAMPGSDDRREKTQADIAKEVGVRNAVEENDVCLDRILR
jgi:hypothetical protein